MSYPNVTLLIPGPICPENSSVWMIKLPLIKTQYIVIIFSHSTVSYLHHPTSENIPLSSCYSTPCDFSPPHPLFLSSLLYVSSWPLVTSFSSFLTTFLSLHSIRFCSSKELNCTRQDVWWWEAEGAKIALFVIMGLGSVQDTRSFCILLILEFITLLIIIGRGNQQFFKKNNSNNYNKISEILVSVLQLYFLPKGLFDFRDHAKELPLASHFRGIYSCSGK